MADARFALMCSLVSVALAATACGSSSANAPGAGGTDGGSGAAGTGGSAAAGAGGVGATGGAAGTGGGGAAGSGGSSTGGTGGGGGNGGAPADGSPYPMSSVIAGITFDQSTLEKAAPGSDQFGYTTASDDNIYVAWGDGGGFQGTNSLGRASLGVGRIEGTPPAWTAFNVWGGVNPESKQASTLGKTSNGVIAVGGAIYLYVDEQNVWTNNHLWKSTDLGMTWTDLGQMFKEPGGAFAEPGVLQFGPDDQGARDNYIYGYDDIAFADGLAMFRVDKTKIESRAAYEFFAGMDGSGAPTWSSDISKIARVFTDPNGTEWGVTATYDPILKRYLLAVRHNGESGEWGLFDAPEPWGPWTTVGYGSDFPDWTYTPDPNGASANRPAYMHNFPAKWMSSDGKTVWQISDRGDQFNLVRATLTLVGG